MPRRLLLLTVQGGAPQPTYGVVNDISDRGAGIVADRLLPSGRDVRLRICFYPRVCFDTEARVVWGRDALQVRGGGNGLAVNGVLFAGPLDLQTVDSPGNAAQDDRSRLDAVLAASLEYLEYQIPNYPFDRSLDQLFVAELLADFPDVDLLEEIKTFRWYYDSDPVAKVSNPRAALRRWMFSSPSIGPIRGNGNAGNSWRKGPSPSLEAFGSWLSLLKN